MSVQRRLLSTALIVSVASLTAMLALVSPSQAQDESMVIKGRLVQETGQPAGEIWLTLFHLVEGKASVKFQDGILQNPAATTDKGGGFSMKLIPGRFPESDSFMLLANMNGRNYPLQNEIGAEVVLKFEKPYKDVDLGTIKLKLE